METVGLIESFQEFKEFKDIDRETLMKILEDVFRNMIQKKYGSDDNYDFIINIDKGDLEVWYVNNQSLYLYFKFIFLTIFVVYIPKSKLPNYLLKDAPEPNKDILSFFRLY